jgi:S-formylglutathione hydrolase FrmB
LKIAMEKGKSAPFIVVVVNGSGPFGGSFYANSPSTGMWRDYVTREVVPLVDAKFRTIADRGHRMIAGFSMGGFGALDLAFREPEEFGAVWAIAMNGSIRPTLRARYRPCLSLRKKTAACVFSRASCRNTTFRA